MVTIFTGLKYCSALIDRDTVRPNVEESLRILSEEGDYKRFVAPLSVSQLDNYTDALMIGEVLARHPDASAFKNMLRSPIYCHDDTISNSLGTYLVVTHQLLIGCLITIAIGTATMSPCDQCLQSEI